MAKPVTLLEQLCGHAMSFGAQSFETERNDGRQRAFAQIDDARTRIANFEDSSTDAKELRANLYAATKKPVRTVIGGKVYILRVRVFEILSCDSRYDQDPGAQWAHRKNAWAAPLHSPPCRTGVPAAIEVALAMKSKDRRALVSGWGGDNLPWLWK